VKQFSATTEQSSGHRSLPASRRGPWPTLRRDQRYPILLEIHRLTGAQLGALARFDMAVDADQAGFDRGVRGAAGTEQAGGFEQLIELDEFASDGEFEHLLFGHDIFPACF